MNREVLERCVKENLSTTDIARKFGIGQTTARYWLKKYNLQTQWKGYLENRFKYSDDHLRIVWNESDSVNQFLMKLGVSSSGGAWYHYQQRLQKLGIDTRSKTLSGKIRGGLTTARLANTQAIKRRKRLQRTCLKKFLSLNSKLYQCSICGIKEWRGKILKLHIHHINGDKTDNMIENLEYLCPNCHTITHYTEI